MTIVRVRVGAVVLMGLMLMPLAAHSDDAADVNAAMDRMVELVNAGDFDGIAGLMTENFVSYAGNSPFVADGRDGFVEALRQGDAANESSQFVIFGDRVVRITGRTAVVAYMAGNFWKPIDGPSQSEYLNGITTWVKVGREWKCISFMARLIPHGSAP
jgi:ketosteroid isomerase-like protein